MQIGLHIVILNAILFSFRWVCNRQVARRWWETADLHAFFLLTHAS